MSDTSTTAPNRDELLTTSNVEATDGTSALDNFESPFEQFYEDQSKVNPKRKVGLLLVVAASGIVEKFSLADITEVPFKDRANIRPNRDVIRAEINRRDPNLKIPVKTKISDMLKILEETTEEVMTANCIKFVKANFFEIREQFQREYE
jgi:hypothetical protein